MEWTIENLTTSVAIQYARSVYSNNNVALVCVPCFEQTSLFQRCHFSEIFLERTSTRPQRHRLYIYPLPPIAYAFPHLQISTSLYTFPT